MREFDEESLKRFDGKEGRPAYVAAEGRVYDVTTSVRWKEGFHMRRHRAGADLSTDLGAAPHGPEKLSSFPHVGVVVAAGSKEATGLPGRAARLLERFPTLRRHPHPMTVHFPIVFAFASFFFSVLRVVFGVESFGTTALHCLAAGALFTPVAMVTGFATWKINYLGKPMAPVRWKLGLSFVLWAVFCGGSFWQFLVPAAVGVWVPVIMGAAAATCAAIVGWLGASLTFPVKRG